ncbi:cell division protein SepF [Corynebacterium sputi]|uniref:cell division protein SepF n=1 Tax=Corynebacterium sputi TaxID=489915 RepID=UPI000412562A|nr:cell division protein SepF [Corynebacterium sputi]
MAESMKKFKEFFGLNPIDDRQYEPGYIDEIDEYDRGGRYADDRYSDDYVEYDEPRGYRHNPEPLTPAPLPPMETPVVPKHVYFKPSSSFMAKYSEARQIGERFREGDIVTFDLVDLAPEERKRYLDFAAGMSFALCGKIEREGTSFTLLPEGVDMSATGTGRRSALSG